MFKTLCTGLLVLASASPVLAQVYHPNDALGELLAKTKSLSMPNNAGGKNILENSCIFKTDFSISASEQLLDHCDIPGAISQFVAKRGQPDQTANAPGGKTVLEYFLVYKENQYHVKIFIGCADAKTETFAMVECVNEKNRVMPGGPPKGGAGKPGGGRP